MYGNFFEQVQRIWSGYPGGYKKQARGTQGQWKTPPFQQPDDPNDIRSKIPALGHREYWYPALPDRDIGWARPQVLRMLGKDLVFFRGKDGAVRALLDACPHRGAYLSMGDCFYKGHVTCPYHGATFDGDGNCTAMITEGPDSKLVGEMKAWPFPTITVKGVVFVWMGEGQPVDPREDIPPELFDEPYTILRWACHVVQCNWILVLENTNDAHNCFFVHRNCISVLRNRLGGRPRTPLGYRTKVVGGVTANYSAGSGVAPTERYYFDEQGNIPYQMYYPGVDGVWPLHRYRLLWTWFYDRVRRSRARQRGAMGIERGGGNDITGRGRRGIDGRPAAYTRGEDPWQGTRLPSISAKGTGGNSVFRSHRWAVPVERDMTRICYINIERYLTPPSFKTRFMRGLSWPARSYSHNYNFRYADVDAERTCQYNIPEYLSASDSTVVVIRKVLTEYARGVRNPEMPDELLTREEEEVKRRYVEALEVAQASSLHSERIKEGLTETGFLDKQ
jgi:phenylpropionate dioxygenase-like ring-hydroxylating dioxygenase large terminal subunit